MNQHERIDNFDKNLWYLHNSLQNLIKIEEPIKIISTLKFLLRNIEDSLEYAPIYYELLRKGLNDCEGHILSFGIVNISSTQADFLKKAEREITFMHSNLKKLKEEVYSN